MAHHSLPARVVRLHPFAILPGYCNGGCSLRELLCPWLGATNFLLLGAGRYAGPTSLFYAVQLCGRDSASGLTFSQLVLGLGRWRTTKQGK